MDESFKYNEKDLLSSRCPAAHIERWRTNIPRLDSTNGGTSNSSLQNNYAIGAVEGCTFTFDWEVSSESNYNWTTYKYCNGNETMTKYCANSNYGTVDNKTTLEPGDDVAYVK